MKNSFRAVVHSIWALAILVTSASAAITVNSPANGSTVGTTVNFSASANSGYGPITAMRIYVDGQSKYSTNGGSLNTTLTLAGGTRNIRIVAWDTTGHSQYNDRQIRVSGSSADTQPGSTSVAGVNISSPSNGATVGSPVRVAASAAASRPIVHMKIYADGREVFGQNVASVDTQVQLASGSRNLTIQAWDNAGTVYKQAITVNVSGTSTGGGSTSPSAPSGARVFERIEDMDGWDHCNVCSGADANGPAVPYARVMGRTNPTMDGKSTEHWLGGDTPYGSAIWWKQLGGNNNVKNFVYEVNFYIKNVAASQGLEFDLNQSVNGKKYIFATECNYRDTGTWKVWDPQNVRWVSTGIACDKPNAYAWNKVVWEFRRTDDYKVHYISVTLNGKKIYINKYFNYRPVTASAYEINVAFQMDGNYKQEDYSVWLDQVKLSYW